MYKYAEGLHRTLTLANLRCWQHRRLNTRRKNIVLYRLVLSSENGLILKAVKLSNVVVSKVLGNNFDDTINGGREGIEKIMTADDKVRKERRGSKWYKKVDDVIS